MQKEIEMSALDFSDELVSVVLIQHKSIKIDCKYCGVEDFANVMPGRGPHAYEVCCAHCCKHYKWASKYDVEEFTDDELRADLAEMEKYIQDNPDKPCYGENARIAKIQILLGQNK